MILTRFVAGNVVEIRVRWRDTADAPVEADGTLIRVWQDGDTAAIELTPELGDETWYVVEWQPPAAGTWFAQATASDPPAVTLRGEIQVEPTSYPS